MPAVQTTYPTTMAAASLGMVANGEWVTNVISRIVDPASAIPVNFGDPVLQGGSDQLVVSANGGTGAFRGIAVREPTLPPGNNDQYLAGNSIGVLTKGVIWLQAAAAVTAGQSAYLTPAGALTGSATGNAVIPGAIWDSATTGAGLAKLRLG